MIFGSLGVEISFEWGLYLGMGLDPLIVLNLSA